MIELSFQYIDWVVIRQSLGLSLHLKQPVAIRGGNEYISANSFSEGMFRTIQTFCTEHGAGRLERNRQDIIFEPGFIAAGTIEIKTGKFSSVTDLFMFLMPALLFQDFRSVINLGGVTHSALSPSPPFIKETFLALLEQCGLYGSLLLRRFGFYGTGGGSVEARVYPAEPRAVRLLAENEPPRIQGARIFASRAGRDLASQQKEMLTHGLDIPAGQVSIIEILDSDGPGNAAQVTIGYGESTLVIDRVMDFYNDAGDFIFEREALLAGVEGLIRETSSCIGDTGVPGFIKRELIPYCRMTGSDLAGGSGSPACSASDYLCTKLL